MEMKEKCQCLGEAEGAVLASLPCLLQLLWQKKFFSCKLVEGNEKANGTGLWADERMEDP